MNLLLKTVLLGLLLSPSVQAQPGGFERPVNLLPNLPNLPNHPSLPADRRCQISTSSPEINYGDMSPAQLQELAGGRRLTPGKRMMTVSVTCPYSQSMRLTLRGERASNGDLRYGERGSLSLRMLEAQLDGRPVQLTTTKADGRLNGSARSDVALRPGDSVAATQNGQRIVGKNFQLQLEVEPVMPESATRVTARQVNEALLRLDLAD